MNFSNSQYDEIMSIYEQRQKENKAMLEKRRQEVYAAIPRIAEIDRTIAASSIESARASLTDETDSTMQTKAQNQMLIDEKAALLGEHGYSKDYLKPIYTCPICRDTGIIDNAYCSCYRQAVISLLYKQSALGRILETENFEHFNLDFYPRENDGKHPHSPYEYMGEILSEAKNFVENFDEMKSNFLFFGDTGLGKTFLSNCIAKALLDTGHTVLYQSAVHLFEDVCADVIMNKNQNTESQDTHRYLYRCDLLIIDDLGTEYTNSFVSSTLYDILNTRMRENKSTIISTNLDLQELTKRYSDRISTRILAAYKVYNFYGSNIRLAKRRQSLQNER